MELSKRTTADTTGVLESHRHLDHLKLQISLGTSLTTLAHFSLDIRKYCLDLFDRFPGGTDIGQKTLDVILFKLWIEFIM